MSTRSLTIHLRKRIVGAAVVAAVALLGAGCGLQESVEQAVEEGAEAAQEAAEEAAREAAEEVAEDVADGAIDAAGDAVGDAADAVGDAVDGHPFDQRLRDEADSLAEVSTSDGGLVAVAIECESQLGGSLMHVGMRGIAPGLYESEITPSSGSMDVNIVEDGAGLAIRQSRFEEPSYVVAYPGIDGSVSLTVEGCPAS